VGAVCDCKGDDRLFAVDRGACDGVLGVDQLEGLLCDELEELVVGLASPAATDASVRKFESLRSSAAWRRSNSAASRVSRYPPRTI
jgi:hypothetical protein